MRAYRASRKAAGRPVLHGPRSKPSRATLDKSNAWKTVDRAVRKLEGRCRDCGEPSSLSRWNNVHDGSAPRYALRCTACHQRYSPAVPLALFGAIKASHRHALHPELTDRRHGGVPNYALAWALIQHRERHEPCSDGVLTDDPSPNEDRNI